MSCRSCGVSDQHAGLRTNHVHSAQVEDTGYNVVVFLSASLRVSVLFTRQSGRLLVPFTLFTVCASSSDGDGRGRLLLAVARAAARSVAGPEAPDAGRAGVGGASVAIVEVRAAIGVGVVVRAITAIRERLACRPCYSDVGDDLPVGVMVAVGVGSTATVVTGAVMVPLWLTLRSVSPWEEARLRGTRPRGWCQSSCRSIRNRQAS